MLNIFKIRVFVAVLCLGMIPGAWVRAQVGVPVQHQSWSTEEGLPQTSVHQILQTRDGYLWLTTEGGAVRYDGVTFKVLSQETEPAFTSNDVTSLAEDRDGAMWFGTADGLLERVDGKMRRFDERDGLPSSSVLSLAAAVDGTVLALTDAGLVRFDGVKFTRVNADVEQLQTGADGQVIAVTARGALAWAGGQLKPLGMEGIGEGAALRGVEIGRRGESWAWSEQEVVASGGGRTAVWRIGRELPGMRVQTVFVDRRGVAWVGTNRGLVTLRQGSEKPTAVEALGANSILSVMEDREGDLWIGTETSGLHALRPRKFRQQPGLADEEVSAVIQASDGTMWIGTREDGLRRVRSGMVERPVANRALTSPIVLSLSPGLKGDLWVGTPDGLNHVEASGAVTQYTSSDGLPDDLVRSLLVAQDGTLWAGTRRGLAHLVGGRVEVLAKDRGLGSDLVGTLFQRDGEVWVGTLSGLSVVTPGGVRNYGRAEGLTSNLVTSMGLDSAGRMWVGTREAGLFLFEAGRFLPVSGVPQRIFSVEADGLGFLWMRGEHGVVREATERLARCAEHGVCAPVPGAYGVEEGMPSDELVANGNPAAWRTTSGELWFASRKGVAIAEPADLPVNTVPPPVVLERFLVDNEEVRLGQGLIRISSGRARYTFDFAGLSFVVPAKVVYRSKLEGFDRDWSAASGRRNASYTNLPPGLYTFRVQAANNDGVWNDAGASVAFRVLPPFYRRWWFVLAVLVVLAAVVVLLYRLRVRRLQRGFDAVLAERNRIAREIHDTLAQDFVGVSLQLDLVSQMLARNSVPEAARQLKVTKSFVKAGLDEARQSIWNLRADTAKDSLPTRLTELVKRFDGGEMAVKIKIGGAYRVLPVAVEDETLRIVQEAISNVERHAGAQAVQVEVTYAQDKLVVRVADDGRGFSVSDARVKEGHFGLRGMHERAATLGAELKMTSSTGQGTILELTVPITEKRGWQR